MRFLPLLLACAGPSADDTGPPDADLPYGQLADANNYTFTGALDVPEVVTVSGADVEICWDDVLHDLQCHGLDPDADIDNVGLVRFPNLGHAEIEAALSTNALQQADISGYVEHPADGTCARLADFSFFGTGIDVTEEYTDAGGAYLLLLTEGTTPGVGARMLTFLTPRADSDVAAVSVPDGCGLLEVDADLAALTPVPMPAAAPWTVDWSTLTRDGQGNPVAVEDIDSLMLGFYAGRTPADLAAGLLDLETAADVLYTAPLAGGTTADLADATGTGGAFAGFSGDGTWLLALRCSRCYNPAPVFLTVLEVR